MQEEKNSPADKEMTAGEHFKEAIRMWGPWRVPLFGAALSAFFYWLYSGC